MNEKDVILEHLKKRIVLVTDSHARATCAHSCLRRNTVRMEDSQLKKS